MIKANELRKGVLIIDYTGIVREVYGEDIQQQCWYEEGQSGTTEAPLNPIPLTPEWLERCGFKKRLINNSFFEYHLPCTPPNYRNEYKLRWWDAETFRSLEWVTVESGSIHKFPCAYLHQLQNLYFALTGEELEIKLP